MPEHRSASFVPGRRSWWAWGIVLILLDLWVAARMGLFSLTSTVTIGGRPVDVLNTYGTVDHPFHASRAAMLLRSLQDGEILRWVGQHQGGYPAEFYPLGVAWLDVGIWAASFGAVSILAAHKVAVILIFLLPSLSYWLLARGDRIHPAVAVLATAVHIAVPGHWLNGGYEELVGWGLITNVAGGSLALLASVALARLVLRREFGMGVLATVAAAAGAVTNPRSLFAVVMAALALFLVAVVQREGADVRVAAGNAIVRIGAVGALALLLAAPVVLALFRYNGLYFFLHYEFYDPISEYWDASAMAVTTPVLLLAIVAVVLHAVPVIGRSLRVSQGIALAGVLYVGLTLWVALSPVVPPLVEQLEAPRLMPFQRQVMIWLGASAIWIALRWLIQRVGPLHARQVLAAGVPAMLALFILVAHVRPLGFVPEEQVALRDISLTGNTDYADFQAAIELGEGARPDGTVMFVIGNRDDWWHEQIWAPAFTDARLYYDDWLWYWHERHAGPYNPENGYWFPNPTDALEGAYLDDNGIGVVVVGDMYVPSGVPPRQSARSNPRLEAVGSVGAWDVYTVRNPSSIMTDGDRRPERVEIGNEEINATFAEGKGSIVLRQNWFPRWEATVNGERVPIERRDDGYMQIQAPEGPVEVRFAYTVTALDWAGRGAVVLGIVMLGMAVWRGPALLRRLDGPGEPSSPRSSSSREGSA